MRDILQHKTFQEVYTEQSEKITKAMVPYKSKRQRQIEESAARREAEGATVRQVWPNTACIIHRTVYNSRKALLEHLFLVSLVAVCLIMISLGYVVLWRCRNTSRTWGCSLSHWRTPPWRMFYQSSAETTTVERTKAPKVPLSQLHIYINIYGDDSVADALRSSCLVLFCLVWSRGTGVPRHLRESHVEERQRQRQPDLSAYGPLSAASEFEAKVSHGNRQSFGEVRFACDTVHDWSFVADSTGFREGTQTRSSSQRAVVLWQTATNLQSATASGKRWLLV